MNTTWKRRILPALAMGAAAALTLAGCSSSSSGGAEAGDGKGTIVIWAHQGQDSENASIQQAVKDFNASQSNITAKLKILATDTYATTVKNTPKDQLPDVLEMDGSSVAENAYDGKLSPLNGFVSKNVIDNATSGSIAEGTYDGKLYALAMYDSALGIYGNKKLLDAAGVKYPTSVGDAWTASEFSDALKALAAKSSSGKSLDIQEQTGMASEWGTYGFSPLLQSAGGNLLKDAKAEGVLDSSASVKALTDFQSWQQYVDPNASGNAFQNGDVALSWVGHWLYPQYEKALGNNLVALPLPNMGEGTKTGAGSWTWGLSSNTKQGAAAGKFMSFLLNDKTVTAMTTANGAPAATKSVFATQKTYQAGGQLALWGDQLSKSCPALDITPDCVAAYRPATPGYSTVTSKFSSALSAIVKGADVKTQLTNAAKAIDQDYADNNDYK